jgi:hypothetical protein
MPKGQAPRSKRTSRTVSHQNKAREGMKQSPEVRKAMSAEDKAMERWFQLKDTKGKDDPATKKAYQDYKDKAKKRTKTAKAKSTGYAKGGLVKSTGKLNTGIKSCGHA